MTFLLQKNIWREYAYDRFLASLINYHINYKEVHVIPFTDTFDEEIDFVPDYCFGSGRFVNICRARGFPTFPSYSPIETHYYPNQFWVNGDGYDCYWKDLPDTIDHPVFIKPYTEKFFTGTIIDNKDDLDKIQLATSFLKRDEGDELIRVSEIVDIKDEIRFFVINNNIISASYYKMNGRAKQQRIDAAHDGWLWLEKFLDYYDYIDEAFVIDLGLVKEGWKWKIVELNNLNSAGFYECDTDAIVRSLVNS